jgi:uncharacterized protein (UPF0297 family)
MNYKYYILTVRAAKTLSETNAMIETELNKWGEAGWHLITIIPSNQIVGTLMSGQPRIETNYQVFLEKSETKTN